MTYFVDFDQVYECVDCDKFYEYTDLDQVYECVDCDKFYDYTDFDQEYEYINFVKVYESINTYPVDLTIRVSIYPVNFDLIYDRDYQYLPCWFWQGL